MRFAVFVMTYNRPEILGKTIVSLLGQTVQPEKILVIDNDPLKSAKQVVEKHVSLPLEYYSTGSNIGPAGAAKAGLEKLAKEGFDWIGWMDDDDPPVFSDSFELLLKLATSNEKCGSVGAVGHYFNKNKGFIKRVTDEQLEGTGTISVDNIAGGMCKIVNATAIQKDNILPNEKLFYGFEELEFDLRLKNAGYSLLTDKDLYKRNRINANRIGFQLKRGKKKEYSRLWREYYSTRNMLYILHQHKSTKAVFTTILRSLLKSIAGFKFGFTYGITNAKYLLLGIFHFLKGKTGSLIIK
jgi:GT2 family glycosyltransferase